MLAALLEVAEAPEVERPPHIAKPHTPLAGRVNLANGHAFAPTFRPGPPPPTQSLEGRILARLAVAPGSPRGLASILDIKEAFVAQTRRTLPNPTPKRTPGPPPAVAYSDAEDAQLLVLKAQGLTETEIAAQTGRSRWNVRRRLVWLNGREAKRAASRPPVRATDHVPEAQAKACERHARACLAAGGFWALSERRVGQGQLVACLPLIPPPGLLEGAQ